MKKINLAVLFGGRSAEHEVSAISAKNVITALDKKKYNLVLIGISKSGKWFLQENSQTKKEQLKIVESKNQVAFISGDYGKLTVLSKPNKVIKIDAVFPVLHGPFGEDGTVQGLLKLANVPFVGPGVLGSAVGMDKDVMKRLLMDADLPIGDFLVFKDFEKISYENVLKKIGSPFFVKPANLGSSVGISKVKNKKDFKKAIKEAFKYDRKIIIEENIKGREIECAVLGNDKPMASIPGEVIASHEFYSYEAKYLDEKGATLEIPAKLNKNTKNKIQKLAVETFKALSCEGLGRVDFFLKNNGEITVNEINTIPGFTSISMYPKLWEASGIKYTDLIDKLIQLAIERFKKESKLKVSL